jgi:predicted component of type VI protein secretion system
VYSIPTFLNHAEVIRMTMKMSKPRVLFVTRMAGFFTILMITGAFALSQTATVNTAFGEAVPLIPVNTGDPKLNDELPQFYDCIEEAVDNSFSSTEPNYFKEEPTRAEVRGCYESTIVSGTSQPTSQPVSQPTSQPVSQPTSQPVSQPTSQPVSQLTSHHKYVASQ